MKRRRPLLRHLRIGAATLCMVAMLAAFLDYRDALPPGLKHAITSIQFLPSAISLASGAALSLACIIILVATLAAGRIYCSTLCPLGVLQDIVIHLSRALQRKRNQKDKPLPHRPAYNKTRYTILALGLVAVITGWGGLALAWLDPYSHFGRFAGTLFRPPVIAANNLAASLAQYFGSNSIPQVAPAWAGLGVLLPILAIFGAVIYMSARHGRLWCNTVCPVGALLGLVSKKSLFRLAIGRDACVRCGDCLRSCKAQCIDLRKQEIDFSRCVGCFDCVSVCDEGGLHYRWLGRTPNAPAAANVQRPTLNVQHSNNTTDIDDAQTSHLNVERSALNVERFPPLPSPPPAPPASRRAFLATLATGALTLATTRGQEHNRSEISNTNAQPVRGKAIAPPGARSIDRFVAQCTACQLCVSACPSHVLEPTLFGYGSVEGFMKPRLNFERSFCNINCTTCGDVCPDHAIARLSHADKQTTRIGVAHVRRSHCIVITDGTACGACAEHCPTAALQMKQHGAPHAEPVVDARYCIGCGACQFACPALPKKAVVVHGLDTHEKADVLVQEKAAAPAGSNDFAF